MNVSKPRISARGSHATSDGLLARIHYVSNSNKTPIVYFDGSCPLCTREIAVYKGAEGAQNVTWCDVSQHRLPSDLDAIQAMARFHVRDVDGQLLSGAKAFIALWLALPRWRWLGRMASVPPVPLMLEGAYRLFLILRPWMQRLARRMLS